MMNTKKLIQKADYFFRPFLVILYTLAIPILFYWWKKDFLGAHPNINLFAFNTVCGIIFLIGWYLSMAISTRSLSLNQTFPLRCQYLLSFAILTYCHHYELDIFGQYMVQPEVMNGMMMALYVGLVFMYGVLFFIIFSLCMWKCRFPSKISLKNLIPQKKWKYLFYVPIWIIMFFFLFSSFEDLYTGLFYDGARCWFILYIVLSIFSGIKNKESRLLDNK